MVNVIRHPSIKRAASVLCILGLITAAVLLGNAVNQRGAEQRALHESMRGAACNYACTLTIAQQNRVWYRRSLAGQTSEISVHD